MAVRVTDGVERVTEKLVEGAESDAGFSYR